MSFVTRLKKFIRNFTPTAKFNIGRVAVLVEDWSLSFHLISSDEMAPHPDEPGEINLGPGYSYGFTLEPFMLNIIGKDGDVLWNSPGWDMSSWAIEKEPEEKVWVDLGEMSVIRCGIQGRSGAYCIFGDFGSPCLGYGLRFVDRKKGYLSGEVFIPDENHGMKYSGIGDFCHSIDIHADDEEEFFQRIKKHTSEKGFWHGE